MRIAKTSLFALAALLFATPGAMAKGEDDCTTKVVEICDVSEAAMFDEAFGTFGDIVLIVLALLAVAAVINLLIALLRRLKPRRLLRLTVTDKVREVEPGGSVRYKVEVENVQNRYPVEVFLEHDSLPTGWESAVKAAVVLPSGFRMPQETGQLNSFVLSSAARGSNSALIEYKVTAPNEATTEETVETELRVVPVLRGHLRKRSAKKAALTILLVPHLPKVQIMKVTHRPERIAVGQPVMTTATVVNKGEREAHDVAVSFTVNGSEMDKKVVPALAVQGAADVEFNWTPHSGENKIRVAVAT